MAIYPAGAVERAMKIQEVILRAVSGKILWCQAAEIIGISDRSMRRWRRRYEEYGYTDLFDRRRKRPSPKRVDLAIVEKVLKLYRERYFDFNVRHFVEKLQGEHDIALSYTWVKTALQTAGLVEKSRKRGKHHKKRPRRPLPGMMLHVDGSTHGWLGGAERQDLIAVLDDANNQVYYAQLVEQESTTTVMTALKEVIQRQGLFCSLYSDRGSHFVHTPKAGEGFDPRNKTQIGRALQQLGIELIAANSPQARGRCERFFGTWQGRLPQELRLRKIDTLAAANQFLTDYWLDYHNKNFAVTASQPGTAFLPYRGRELETIFSLQHDRVVGNDNTVTFGKLSLQIEPQRFRHTLAKCRVLVCQHLNETITLHYGPHALGRYDGTGELIVPGKAQRRKGKAA
jgi:transposase